MPMPKGFKHSEETKLKIGKWSKGRKHTLEELQKMSQALSGDKNPMYGVHKYGKEAPCWKGGRKVTDEGYVLIYKPEHPNCNNHGYVPEHRLVMEKFLGRYLKRGEIVHHINGIHDDNRIENLMLFENISKHIKHHRKQGMLV
jgi:uncharacterized protein (DUF1330 family)